MDKIRKVSQHTFASLQIKNYRLYFTGQAISLTGTWMQVAAVGLLVLQLSGSGTVLGTVLALQFLPVLLFSPIAGVFVDRYPKRSILFVTQISMSLLALALGTLIELHLIQLWMVYVFALCMGLLGAVDNPTRNVFITELVGKEFTKNAIALNMSEVSMARIVGPALAGLFILTVGIAFCFLYNGLSYLGIIIALLLMDKKQINEPHQSANHKNQLREGFKYVWSSPVLRQTLLIMALLGTLTYEFQVSLPLLAQFTFHNPTKGYASLMSAMGAGAIIGAVFSASKYTTNPQKLILTTLLFGISILIVSLTPNLTAAILGMVLVGFFSVNFMTIANTILQTHAAPEMKGRVMSFWAVAFLGTTPIGAPIIGWIGEHVGPRWALAVGSLTALTTACIGWALFNQKTFALLISGKFKFQRLRRLKWSILPNNDSLH